MKPKTYIRLLFLAIIASLSMILLASSAKSRVINKDCPDASKCDQNQVQTEFIIWQTISHSLFGNR
jgi:hypothetical protein